MLIKIKAPEGKKLFDTRTGMEHSEVVTDDKNRSRYAMVDGSEAVVEELPGSASGANYGARIAALEDELSATKILLGVE